MLCGGSAMFTGGGLESQKKWPEWITPAISGHRLLQGRRNERGGGRHGRNGEG